MNPWEIPFSSTLWGVITYAVIDCIVKGGSSMSLRSRYIECALCSLAHTLIRKKEYAALCDGDLSGTLGA